MSAQAAREPDACNVAKWFVASEDFLPTLPSREDTAGTSVLGLQSSKATRCLCSGQLKYLQAGFHPELSD
jgi:hypothetical protein